MLSNLKKKVLDLNYIRIYVEKSIIYKDILFKLKERSSTTMKIFTKYDKKSIF
jgi:hypothetical protein